MTRLKLEADALGNIVYYDVLYFRLREVKVKESFPGIVYSIAATADTKSGFILPIALEQTELRKLSRSDAAGSDRSG